MEISHPPLIPPIVRLSSRRSQGRESSLAPCGSLQLDNFLLGKLKGNWHCYSLVPMLQLGNEWLIMLRYRERLHKGLTINNMNNFMLLYHQG